MRGIFLFLFLIVCTSVVGQRYPEKGRFTDSIPIVGKANESYGVYLPDSFDETTLSPIIFVFEPAARAAIGTRPFIPAAEKYGIVVVCSNNSRNGLMNENFRLAENLFADIFDKYAIDPQKMYLAGFSGGSRLASAIATLTDQFAGVIACGAGFSGNQSEVPTTQGFAYAGLCGDQDMNYREMIINQGYLNKLDFANALFSFEGGHRWPPQSEITLALDWLFLQQAIKNKYHEQVDDFYRGDFQRAKNLIKDGQLLFAEENLGRMLNSYHQILALDSVKTTHRNLIKSKAYKEQKGAFDEAMAIELKLNKKLLDRFFEDYKAPGAANFKWWQKEFDKLGHFSSQNDPYIKKMAARVRYNLYAAAAERGNPNLFPSNKEQLIFCGTLRDMVYSKK